MMTITECTELPEGFDTLIDQSLPILEEGTIDWRYMGNPVDTSAKKEKMREVYQQHIDNPFSHVLYWVKEGAPIHLVAGSAKPDDERYVQWNYSLFGKDATGSKSWLFDPAYLLQTKEYMRDTMGLLGYVLSCQKGSSIYDYHMSKVGASELYEVTEERVFTPEEATDISIAIIRYKYL